MGGWSDQILSAGNRVQKLAVRKLEGTQDQKVLTQNPKISITLENSIRYEFFLRGWSPEDLNRDGKGVASQCDL